MCVAGSLAQELLSLRAARLAERVQDFLFLVIRLLPLAASSDEHAAWLYSLVAFSHIAVTASAELATSVGQAMQDEFRCVRTGARWECARGRADMPAPTDTTWGTQHGWHSSPRTRRCARAPWSCCSRFVRALGCVRERRRSAVRKRNTIRERACYAT